MKTSSTAEASPSAPADSTVSALYRLNASLYPESLWTTKDTILSFTWNEPENSALLGTATDGYTYSVSPHGEATRLCRIDSDSVTTMTSRGSDTILATSNPGRLFRVSHEKSNPGLYETNIVDSESFARWGAVTLNATNPDAVKVLTRSGNTAQPDKTWYPWVAATGAQVQSAPARFLQIQLQIGAGNVDRIDASYLPKNQPPHLDTLKILPVGIGYTPAPASPLPPLPQSASQLLSGGDTADPQTPMRWQIENAHGLRTLIWKATDPNGDNLTYNVSWRKRGETAWHDLATAITDNLITWDTSSWSDGRYELKVVASDAAANAPGEGLTDEAITREMIVNNTPPKIAIVSQENGSVIFNVTDQLDVLREVTISTDGKSYASIEPVDGILDSASERFVAPVAAGQTLFIRAEDASGNVAGAQTTR